MSNNYPYYQNAIDYLDVLEQYFQNQVSDEDLKNYFFDRWPDHSKKNHNLDSRGIESYCEVVGNTFSCIDHWMDLDEYPGNKQEFEVELRALFDKLKTVTIPLLSSERP